MTMTDEKTERIYQVIKSVHAQIAVIHDDLHTIKTRTTGIHTSPRHSQDRLSPIDALDPSLGRADTFGIATRLASIDTRLGLVHNDLTQLTDQLARVNIKALDG